LYEDLTIGASTATAGYSSLTSATWTSGVTVGYSSGLNLTIHGGATVVSCNITFSVAVSLSTIFTAGGQVGFLWYDGSVQWYNTLYASSSTFFTVTVPVPSGGLFVFASWTQTANVPTFYAYARAITAGVSSTVTYAHNISVQLVTGASSALSATYYATNPYSVQVSGYVAVGTWFDLKCSASANISATISYVYSASQLALAGVGNATNLVIGYYDTATAKWVFPSTGGSVNVHSQVVSQTSTHFSTWGVYASAASTPTSSCLKMMPSFAMLLVMLMALII